MLAGVLSKGTLLLLLLPTTTNTLVPRGPYRRAKQQVIYDFPKLTLQAKLTMELNTDV